MSQMTHSQYASSLRMIADWFEAHPEVPLPHDAAEFGLFTVHDREGMEKVARIFGSCEKEYTEGFFKLKKKFGEIEMRVIASRDQVCKRKVVGVKLVPEVTIPAHNKDIVEWECFETPLLAPKDDAIIPIDAPLAQAIRHDQEIEREADAANNPF